MFVSSLIRIRFADYAPFLSWRNGGRFGISPPVGDAVQVKALLKAAHEFGAVVFDPEARRFWQPLTQRVKGDGRLAALMSMAKREWGSMKVDRQRRRPSRRRTTVSQANTSSG
ncbi:hypothetical protein [Candidatus Spongiihabitans sp.]|uniref:hypothetical protein n=1 Tax=Candidatus Spongiihabitans sp. TaxID=3101308 RepID=UPI003C6F5D70